MAIPQDDQMIDATRPRAPVGARVAVVAGGALLGWLLVDRLTSRFDDGGTSLAGHATRAVLALVVGSALVVAARRLLDRRPVASLGLGRRHAVRDLVLGGLSWLVPAAVGLTVALAAGWVRIGIDATLAETVGVVLLLIVLVLAYEAVPEELVFRGYVYRNLAGALPPWLAILVQALVFAAFGTTLWVVAEGWGVLLERFVLFFGMAVVAGCIRLISGSVWAPVGWHLAFQVVMQLVLSSRYLEVTVSSEEVFVLATAVLAFATSPAIAGALWRGPQNWREPEPDVEGRW